MFMNSKDSGTNMNMAVKANSILLKITSADSGLSRNRDDD